MRRAYQFVWWWRIPWRFMWRFVPYPNHGPVCPATGSVYEWIGLIIGPLEIRKWGTIRGGCTCRT